MKRVKSLTTSTKVGIIQRLIEMVVLAKRNPGPYFWNKKKAERFNEEVYRVNTRLYLCLSRVAKTFGAGILISVIKSTTQAQRSKIYDAAKYNQIDQIISSLNYYCGQERARLERLARPKDTSDPEEIVFDAGEDYRNDPKSNQTKTTNLWEFLNGKEED